MSDENRKPCEASAAKVELINHEDGVMPTVENVMASLATATGLKATTNRRHEHEHQQEQEQTPTDVSAGSLAAAATHKVADAASSAADSVVETAKDVSHAVADSTTKASRKVKNDADEALGPYDSPATCANSDMDPLGGFVHLGGDLTSDEPLKERARGDEPSDRK